jgi:hypothetical protein
MSEKPSVPDLEAMPVSGLFKKFKRLRLFEPSVGVLGFVIVTVGVICCFFYLDYRAVAKGFLFLGQRERFVWLKIKGSGEDQRVGFLEQKGCRCDVFEGDWVWDENNIPLYQSKDCRFLDEGFRCSENGRPDLFYTKWRWQPKDRNMSGSQYPNSTKTNRKYLEVVGPLPTGSDGSSATSLAKMGW